MRILAVEPGPHFSVADVHRGWVKGLRNLGAEVLNFNFEHRLDFYSQIEMSRGGETTKALDHEGAVKLASKGIEVAAFEFWPDAVLITSCFFVPPFTLEILRARNMKIVLLMTESPYEDSRQLQQAPYADVVLLNDPTNIEKFLDVNPNTHYFGHAYDPDVHKRYPRDAELRSDFCFVGTGFPSRVGFFEQIDWTGIDVALGGNWQAAKDSPLAKYVAHELEYCIDNSQAAQMYSNTKASANFYRRESQEGSSAAGWAMGPREVELAACGTFFLTEERGENREVLPMVPTFDGPVDFEQQLRFFLNNDGARENIALKAREAIASRTFDSNASRLLGLL